MNLHYTKKPVITTSVMLFTVSVRRVTFINKNIPLVDKLATDLPYNHVEVGPSINCNLPTKFPQTSNSIARQLAPTMTQVRDKRSPTFSVPSVCLC